MYSQALINARRSQVERAFKTALVEHSPAEVLEFAERFKPKDFDEAGSLRRGLTLDEQRFIFNELQLSKLSFRYWAERYASISDDRGRLIQPKLRPGQLRLLERFAELEAANYPLPQGKVALIHVKARRVGATVLGQLMVAHGVYLRAQAQGLTASDIPENTLKLYQIQNRIFDHLPFWMKAEMDGKVKADHLRFPRLDSDLTFGTGNQKNPLGQGVRVDFAHLSELGTWLYPDMIDDDLLPAFMSSRVPSSFMFLESTAKSDKATGEWFEDQYRQAKEGRGVFRAAFLAWYQVPEIHSMPAAGIEFKETTQKVAERIKREVGYECTREQLAFYQVTREQFESKGKLQEFLAEYATTDDEAFQHGHRSVIRIETRDRLRQEAKKPLLIMQWDARTKAFREERSRSEGASLLNRLCVWELPRAGYIYLVAVDGGAGRQDDEHKIDAASPAKGGKDRSAIEVLRLGNRYRPTEQVAQWVGYMKPDDLAGPVEKLGRMYGDKSKNGYPAKLAIEVNIGSPSGQTQDVLLRKGYPNFYIFRRPAKVGGGITKDVGWYTTPMTRQWITDGLVSAIEEGSVIVNSLVTLDEMAHFVNIPKPTQPTHFEAAPGYHDDTLMALAIGLFVGKEPASGVDVQEAERLIALGEAPAITAASFNPQAMVMYPDGSIVTSESLYDEETHGL